jgi:hypothetical protein
MNNHLNVLSRWVLVGSLALLSACGGGGGGGGSGGPPLANDSVVATSSTTSAINVVVGSSTPFSVTFTTDDGKSATNLSITSGLSTLPAGWSGPATFTCASVSTGNGCMLNLTYAPTAADSGTVTLNYSYTNDAGAMKTGTTMVSYAATSADNVVATPLPAGQIAVITGGTSAVGITFATDDGQTATNLSITSGLASLPAGWSGPATFTCPTVSTGSGCVLNLTYAPTAIGSGTVTINYSYTDNAGNAKTGSIMITYTATTHNNLVVTASPSGSISAVVNSGSVPVTLTFTTDDGNPATAVTITSGLGALPSGWSAPATFSCATASTGTGCQLALTYAPTVNGSGTVALGYSYNDDSGTAKTGTANIAYASVPGFLYATDMSSNVIRCAVSGVDGTLSSCASASTGLKVPTGIAFSGNWAYVTPGLVATDVDVCPVNPDGSLGTCTSAQTFTSPAALAVSGGYLYVTDVSGPNAFSCPINADGSLGACKSNYMGVGVDTMVGIAVTATTAYIVDTVGQNLSTCPIDPTDGSFASCSKVTLVGSAPGGGNTPNASPRSATVFGGNLYIGTHASIMILPIATDGTVTVNYPCALNTPGTSCTIDGMGPVQTPVTGLAFNNGFAYAGGFGGGGGISVCTIEASGFLDKCVKSSSPPSADYGGMAVH